MCKFSPFSKAKGHPEGNCEDIIAVSKLNVKSFQKVVIDE